MRVGPNQTSNSKNPGGEIIGAIVVGIAIIVGAFAYGNWLAFSAASGEAGAALAGAFLTFEIVIIVLGLFMLYNIFMRWLEGRQQQQAFAANAVENAQIRDQDHQQAMILAKLTQEQAKAKKANNDAALAQVKLESAQTTSASKEIERLQKQIADLQTQQPTSTNWDVNYTGFDDEHSTIIEHHRD